MLMTGFCMIIFLSHKRVWVRLQAAGSKTRVEIGGSSHRNKMAFEKEMEKMEEMLKTFTPSAEADSKEGPA